MSQHCVDYGEGVHFVICKVRRNTASLADCKRETRANVSQNSSVLHEILQESES